MTMDVHQSSNTKPMGYIYYWRQHSLLILNSVKATMHRHYPMELYLGLEKTFKINFGKGWIEGQAVIIDSNQSHQFDGSDGWCALLMMNPNNSHAHRLRKTILRNQKFKALGVEPLIPYVKELLNYRHHAHPVNDTVFLADSILNALAKPATGNESLDPRISEVDKILRDLPEKRISAKKLAEMIHVSESHLAHLFKRETGTPIRRFLLWLKIMDAFKHINNGMSFTDAAYEAGFADSAHLSRTYRQMFGLSPSDLLNAKQCTVVYSSQ